MFKKVTIVTVFLTVLTAGAALFAANYTVAGLSFNGVMASSSDSDTLTLQGQEGLNPNICLQHAPNVDFDIAVMNTSTQVGSNLGLQPRTCVRANTPGRVTVRVWSARGTGPYTVTIQP